MVVNSLPRVARQYHYVVIISLAPRGSDFFISAACYVTCGRYATNHERAGSEVVNNSGASWKVKLSPYPVGSTADTCFSSRKAFRAIVCSSFRDNICSNSFTALTMAASIFVVFAFEYWALVGSDHLTPASLCILEPDWRDGK